MVCSVEGAEYKSIHDRLDALALMKNQTADAEREKQAHNAGALSGVPAVEMSSSVSHSASATPLNSAPEEVVHSAPETPPQTLEQRVQNLRRQVERLVKSPGAPLKAAPFHTATTLQALPTGTEVLVEISTPYWLGVETHNRQ